MTEFTADGIDRTTTLKVSGLTCGHCVAHVTEELEALDGVKDVSVLLNKGGQSTVTVLSDIRLDDAALAEAMRLVGEANAYVARTEPFKLKAPEQRERLATVLHTLVQSVWDLNTMMSVFLPHSSNAIDRVLGGQGDIAPMPRLVDVDDLDGGDPYPIITGDYSHVRPWESSAVVPGTPIAKPRPVFAKLDESVVDEELQRLGLTE